MKKQHVIKLTSIFLVVLMCIGVFTSCDYNLSSDYSLKDLLNEYTEEETNSTTEEQSETTKEGVYVVDVKNVDGTYYVVYSDGTQTALGGTSVNQTIEQNQIIVQGDTTVNVSEKAASKALLSTVCILCLFHESYSYRSWSGLQTATQDSYSAGSGVFYLMDKAQGNAYVITNFHVVYDSYCNTDNKISDEISVYMYGSSDAISATFVGGSALYDIAVLKIEDSEILKSSAAEQVTVADSSATLSVGTTVFAVGNPEGEGISCTQGIISVDSEYITMTAVDNSGSVSLRVVRVDAAVNEGNSGGGLFDVKGNLVGIVNAKVSSSSVENIGYAIPSNVATAIAQNIIDYSNGYVMRAILGVTLTSESSKMVYNTETGLTSIVEEVVVSSVNEDSLADKAGLQEGDRMYSVKLGDRDELTISRSFQLIDELLNARVGDVITFKVKSKGEETEKTITIEITEDCLTEY